MRNLITRWIASALALFLIAQVGFGIHLKNHDASTLMTLAVATVAIGLANAVIRPIIMFFAWPVNCLTFGLFGFVVNAVLFWVAGSGLIPGFQVDGFVPALIGSIAMAFLSGLINFLLKDRGDRDN